MTKFLVTQEGIVIDRFEPEEIPSYFDFKISNLINTEVVFKKNKIIIKEKTSKEYAERINKMELEWKEYNKMMKKQQQKE